MCDSTTIKEEMCACVEKKKKKDDFIQTSGNVFNKWEYTKWKDSIHTVYAECCTL